MAYDDVKVRLLSSNVLKMNEILFIVNIPAHNYSLEQ
jgi:hypothetical protein